MVWYRNYREVNDMPVLPAPGTRYYWPSMVNLTGTNVLTDLAAQPIDTLPANALIDVIIPGRGASSWQRVQDATSPATDVEGGVIQPVGYNALTKPYVLVRQEGL